MELNSENIIKAVNNAIRVLNKAGSDQPWIIPDTEYDIMIKTGCISKNDPNYKRVSSKKLKKHFK